MLEKIRCLTTAELYFLAAAEQLYKFGRTCIWGSFRKGVEIFITKFCIVIDH